MHPHMDFACAMLAQQLDDWPARRPTHNRVIDEHNTLSFDDLRNNVEFELHPLLTEALVRLDKGATDVTVLDQGLGIGNAGCHGIANRGWRR